MKNGSFFLVGAFLVICIGAPTADGGHFDLGISIAVIGLIVMMLGNENLRNPKFLRRQFKVLVWPYFKK